MGSGIGAGFRNGRTAALLLSAVVLSFSTPVAEAGGSGWEATIRPAPVNTESDSLALSTVKGECRPHATGNLPFSVTVDGVPVAGPGLGRDADSQRCADLALERADIQIRYDGLAAEPRLDIVAQPEAALKDGNVIFLTSVNYAAYIERAEVLVFKRGDTVRQRPVFVLPVKEGEARLNDIDQSETELQYVLRVYDAGGRFDETKPKILHLADIRGGKPNAADAAAVYDGNTFEVHNISVTGGAVLVSGTHVDLASHVRVMGAPVPVDREGKFAYRTILPPGPHQVRVEIADAKGRVSEFTRSASIPDHDWFYVALADLTIGKGSAGSNYAILNPDSADEFNNKTYVDGRLAFYLKGKISGQTLLTASADTQEQPVQNMFSNFSSKDPHYLLRELDPDKYYPVYGDDSSLTQDAPTQGKFYVRLERGDSHIMWGNFKTAINGTEFVRYDRGLYGAEAHLATPEVTQYGEKRGEAEVFAAQPGTLGARDAFRGTGGSLYYLQRQNITVGSERVSVEVRDHDTGLVLQSTVLRPSEDYELNALQGRVLLSTPLSSMVSDQFIIQSGSLAGYDQYLVVTYEYAPGLDQADDKVVGGRASYWLNDHVQVGATGYDQSATGTAQKIVGADVTVRYKPGTYIKFEQAGSEGAGDGESVSTDGGFSFNTSTVSGDRAMARRVEAATDLSDLGVGNKGRIAGYWEEKDAGFSGPGNLTADGRAREMGATADVVAGGPWAVKAKMVHTEDQYRTYTSGQTDVTYQVDPHWTVGVGTKIDDNDPVMESASPTLNENGRRVDTGVKLMYDSLRDWSAYIFGQATVERTGERDPNNRIGVGGTTRLTPKLTANAEVSEGDGGLGGKIGTEYQINDTSTAYLSYLLDPDRTDILSRGGEGILVSGARTRFSDSASVFGEERFRHGAGYGGLTHAYGLDFAPVRDWKTGLAFETGTLTDPVTGDTKRTSVSGTIGYLHDTVTYGSKLEYRHDDTTTTTSDGSRNTWLTANSVGLKTNPDWRFVGKFNGSWSDASGGAFADGDYVEAVAGFAYRPVKDDRLNALFKYTYFYDQPSSSQLTPSGLASTYAQNSQVLSADADYDLLPWLTIGGKYAFRFGQLMDLTDPSGLWFDSKAELAIGRLDIHLNKAWDVVGEARVLDDLTASDRKTGALVAVYRHVNENIMIGGGYNFTDFSDDITDLSYKSHGVFFNIVGKF